MFSKKIDLLTWPPEYMGGRIIPAPLRMCHKNIYNKDKMDKKEFRG